MRISTAASIPKRNKVPASAVLALAGAAPSSDTDLIFQPNSAALLLWTAQQQTPVTATLVLAGATPTEIVTTLFTPAANSITLSSDAPLIRAPLTPAAASLMLTPTAPTAQLSTITLTSASSKSVWDSGSNPYTYNSMSIGAADPNRVVVVAITGRRSSSVVSVTAVTIGGISAFIGPYTAQPGGAGGCTIAYANVPTGTSASVVVTNGGAVQDQSIFVYSLVGTPTLPFLLDEQVQNSTASTASVSLTLPSTGAVVAAGLMVDGTNGAITWGGVIDFGTEYATNGTGFNDQKGAASKSINGDSSPLTVTATSTNTTHGLVATSWGLLNTETMPTIVQSKAVINEGGSVTLTSPPTTDNLLVCLEFHFNNGVVAGSGWTAIASADTGVQDGYGIFYKIAGVGESATQTPTTFGSGSGSQVIFEIANFMTIGQSNSSTPGWLDAWFAATDIASAASYSHTETTRGTNELILGAFDCYANQLPTSITNATGTDATANGTSPAARGIEGFHVNAASASSTAITVNNSPNVGGSYASISIRPHQA